MTLAYLVAVLSSEEDMLMSRDMIIGLIVWNLVLSLCVLLLSIALVCVCWDLDKVNRRTTARYAPGGNMAGGLDNPGLGSHGSSPGEGSLGRDMRQLRGEEEVHYYNVSDMDFHRLPSAKF